MKCIQNDDNIVMYILQDFVVGIQKVLLSSLAPSQTLNAIFRKLRFSQQSSWYLQNGCNNFIEKNVVFYKSIL